MYAPQLITERIQILKRIVPDLDKVSMVLNGNNPNNAAQFALLQSQAGPLGVQVQALDVRKADDVERAFEEAEAFGARECSTPSIRSSTRAARRLRSAPRNASCRSSFRISSMCWQAG